MKESRGKQSCFVRSCNEGADIVTKVANQKTVCECFNMFPSGKSVSTATALCNTHYRELYRHIHPTSYVHTCKLCGKDVRGVSKTRKCPDPKLIQDYLMRNCEFNSTIDVDDKIYLVTNLTLLLSIKYNNIQLALTVIYNTH